MKIAVYFSGRVNKYESIVEYLTWWKQVYDIDYFCSLNIPCIDEYHQKFFDGIGMRDVFIQEHAEVYQEDWYDRFKRLQCDHTHVWYKISSSFYNNKMAFELIEKHHQSTPYDIIVKFRADLLPHHGLFFEQPILENSVYIPMNHDCPYHWDDPYYHVLGINDHIAYGDFNTRKIYSTVYDNIDKYCSDGRPYHPESLLLHQLNTNDLQIKRFDFSYGFRTDRHLVTDAFYNPKKNC